MLVPFLDLKAQYQSIKHEVDPVIHAVIDSCAFAGGPFVEAFEQAFASYCGTKHCVALGNGTSALELALRAHGIGSGDEVITATNSFFASAEAISNAGATPILVDCREEDALINPDLIQQVITPRTKAIIPVHLYGQCADMDAILSIAKRYRLLVLEDACQAHGSLYKGRRAGSMGDSAAFSFYPGKNLGAYGEGGAVTTNDDAIASTIRMLRDHGMPEKYKHRLVGRNERMDGIQGAVLGAKLPHLDDWNERRRQHASLYRRLLLHASHVTLLDAHRDREHNYHLFVIRTSQRDALQAVLRQQGVATGIHYPVPIHLQEAYAGRWNHGDFPVAEVMASQLLSLPMYAEMTEEMVHSVVAAITTGMQS